MSKAMGGRGKKGGKEEVVDVEGKRGGELQKGQGQTTSSEKDTSMPILHFRELMVCIK